MPAVSTDIGQIPGRFEPTFARSPRFRGQDRSFDRLGQRKIVLSASKGRLKPAVDSTGTVKRADLARSRHTFAIVACRVSSFGPHAGAGGARSRVVSDRISANICRDTATSAI